jgi:hypothetical protein
VPSPLHPAPTWAEARRRTLERLVEEANHHEFYGFREQLLEVCAEVLARSEGATIVFVGRSPENLYDLLGALLRGVRRAPRLQLLPFSFRTGTLGAAARLARTQGSAVDGLGRHLDELGLGPAEIAQHASGVTFVDCVCWGTTLGNLDEALELLATRRGVDPRAVAARSAYVGLTKESVGWSHWRSDVESGGARLFEQGRASVVPISAQLWHHLAEHSPKTMDSYVPEQWASPAQLPALDPRRARAIRLSVELMSFGRSTAVRKAFASKLARRAHKSGSWLGSLIVQILKNRARRAES